MVKPAYPGAESDPLRLLLAYGTLDSNIESRPRRHVAFWRLAPGG